MDIPAGAIAAAKEAMREVTPPPGVTKSDWLAEHGDFALIAGAIAAAAALIPPAPAPGTVELGYLCSHGHFVFFDDTDLDNTCGSKRVAGVHVAYNKGVLPGMFAGALAEARQDFGAAIGRAYK